MTRGTVQIVINVNIATWQNVMDLIETGYYFDESDVVNEALRDYFRENIEQSLLEIKQKRIEEEKEKN